ncbi:ABC transporter ATP-binding protein [Paenibacillus sp. 481]|uniref:ABC transporter ATP-binding protein n=1 Tax=Paenibacillus sp. 481 TaxID=2835869 RepID=UPI001E30FFC1|nr:ABC transporter ATP-binding protein [Paenibacillus sp. 481]UHA72113.1 ABC transporter ATP-binding protein [Paenibacillus sp. 481]
MIHIQDMKKSFAVGKQTLEVLKGINLVINQGEMIAIMGRSGSGKSTLLHIIAGLDKADSGSYQHREWQMTDKNMDELAAFRKEHIGFVLQNYALIDSKNVFENVALPLRYSKLPKRDIQAKVEQALRVVGISDLTNKSIDMLSGGEMQRVAIARAIVQDPELLLADEPTGSLDEQTEQDVLVLFKELNAQGKTIIIVTHDQQVAAICDKIYYIKEGVCTEVVTDRRIEQYG